jgi:hypothetical protein
MPRVKSAAAIAEKYARVAATRQSDYEDGVKDPGVDWQHATEQAAGSYESGVQEAITAGRFQRGVAKRGTDGWRNKVVTVGASRWAPGVRAAQSDMEAGMTPIVAVIERTQLPPRGPRGDPRNLERAAAMARALSEARKRG